LNLKTTYEKLIAEKVQQIPIPDMADAIWASIELQLDADISSGGEDNSPLQKPWGKGKSRFGNKPYLFIIVAIIVGLVWLAKVKNKKNGVNNTLPNTTISQPQTIIKNDSVQAIRIEPENTKRNILPVPIIQNDKKQTKVDSIKKIIDAPAFTPFSILPVKDTNTSKVFPLKDSLRNIVIPPKAKGVKGISDDDYKIISGKKDSVKKGE
jgi:hypothetical protein